MCAQRSLPSSSTIGFVCPYSFDVAGGVQNHILGLASWLKAQGYRPQIFAPEVPRYGILESYGLDQSNYDSAGKAIALRSNGSIARVNFGWGPRRELQRWLAHRSPDLLHIHEPFTPTVAFHALRQAAIPVVATFHTARPVVSALSWSLRLFPQVVDKISAAIAVSSVAHQVALAHTGLDAVIIGNGISVADYPCQPTKDRWRGGETPLLTFLGRYDEPRKGFPVLVAALEKIKTRFPNLRIAVIGSGRERSIEGITFLGPLNDTERNEWLARSDVYVAPQTGRESFGIVLIETLACGAPVVASDLPAFCDVLSDTTSYAGRLFRVGDPLSLAQEVIASLSEQRDLRLVQGRKLAARYD